MSSQAPDYDGRDAGLPGDLPVCRAGGEAEALSWSVVSADPSGPDFLRYIDEVVRVVPLARSVRSRRAKRVVTTQAATARRACLPGDISVYREILAAASRTGGEPEAHLAFAWSIVRAADPLGTALLRYDDVVRDIWVVRGVKSPRAKEILDEGDGRYWHLRVDPETGERLVSLVAAWNVMVMLGLDRVGPVAVVPLKKCRGRGAPRALAAAAPITTHAEGRQVSRATIARVTGVPRAAQLRFEQQYHLSSTGRQVRRNVAGYLRREPGAQFARIDYEVIRRFRGKPAHYDDFHGHIMHREPDVRSTVGIRLELGSNAHRHINRKIKLFRSLDAASARSSDGGSCVVTAPAELVAPTTQSS